MEVKRLTDVDAAIAYVSFGTATAGDGATPLAAGWYRIAVIGAPTGLPADLAVGDIFYADGTNLIPETGDETEALTLDPACEITSLSIAGSRAETDTTTICDLVKSYRTGKSELTCDFEGVRFIGGSATQISNRNAFWGNEFLPIVTDDGLGNAATSYVLTNTQNSVLYLFGQSHETTEVGEIEETFFLPLRQTSLTPLQVALDSAQVMSGSARVDGSKKPVIYQRTVA